MSETAPPPKQSAIKAFLSGGFGGICLVFAGHPLDRIKVMMQTSAPGTYKSTLDCAKKIVVKDGPVGLYKGMSAPLIGITPIFAICFWGYDMGKKVMCAVNGVSTAPELGIGSIAMAGALSAVPTTAVMAPGERIKCLLQVSDKYKGAGDVVRQLGVRSLFRGTTATLLRDSIGSVGYFGTYELFKRTFAADGNLSPFVTLVGGGLGGIMNWIFCLPFDVVKSRIQTAPEEVRLTIMGEARAMVAEDGFFALYRGMAPALYRAFPANAACFLGVEVSTSFMNKVLPNL